MDEEYEKDTFVGTFRSSKSFGFVVPDDRKFGTDIYVAKRNFGGAKDNYKVVVKITKYPKDGKHPEGKVVEVIGRIDQEGVDMLSLIREYQLPYEFPAQVIEEAKSIKEEISKKDIPNRLDLRDKEIFTIDGEDAKDLDDAVCVEKTSEGTYILGVHIADVSYYVKGGSKLNKEAIKRGTSIYMMDRVIPMLPKELSNGICSLNAGEDRFTISVIMEIDQKGKVISSNIHKSIIKVTERMNYTDVTDILNNAGQERYKKYEPHFKLMEELALILQERRKRDGSLELDFPESKIILDKHGAAFDIQKYEITISNEIIEQFMLTANEVIAEKFFWLQAPFIYRIHEVPDIDKIKELNKFLYNFGYKVKASEESIYTKAFSKVLEEIKGKPEERVISNLVLRTLKLARYATDNKGHFGIASKYYCHFTSPIRRYPDLFIHRVISLYLDNNYNIKESAKDKLAEEAAKYAESSSERERVAQRVERDSIDIKKAEYMQNKIGETYDGIVANVTSFGMFVELDNTVEGLVRFENMEDDYFVYNDENKTLIGERTQKTYKIGDKVQVEVISANKELRRIDFAILKNI
ncbi:MAG: ribonuclease R [Firmicutes bacterium]|nr:ribonuclease R [Bacillota bacterium]